MNGLARIILGLTTALALIPQVAHAAKDSAYGPSTEPMTVSYLRIDGFNAHYNYRYQLIERALELTRAEFGDYQYHSYASQSTSTRYAQLLSEGKHLNILWASPGTPIAQANAITIPIDILKGTLGYRVCLINQNAFSNLDFVNDLTSVGRIKFGQAQWPDRAIYKANNLAEVDAPTFDALFKMLSARRFDCIPLGIDEVEQIYLDKKKQYPFLAIDSHLLIFYYYPVYFYVSKKSPELALRIKLGLQKMQSTGEFDQIFMKYHAEQFARLGLKKRKLICLASPYSVEQGECMLPQIDSTHP
jgi:hypothetical protein